jgi:hypothetical protein
MKTANLPIPTYANSVKKILLTAYDCFTTKDLARLITAQYPSLSFDSQVRLAQIAAKAIRDLSPSVAQKHGYQTEDLKPKKLDGIAVYSRLGAKAILEYMNYEVILL